MAWRHTAVPLGVLTLALAGCGGGSDESVKEAACFDPAFYGAGAKVQLVYELSGAGSGKESWSSTVTGTGGSSGGVTGLIERKEERQTEGQAAIHYLYMKEALKPAGQVAIHERVGTNSQTSIAAWQEDYAPPFIDARSELSVGQSASYAMHGTRSSLGAPMPPSAIDDALAVTFVGKENIRVPAGVYAACRYTTVTRSSGVQKTQWLYRGVLIREESAGVVRAMATGTFNGAAL